MKIKSTLFQLRRFIAKTIHIGCETCQDGKIELTFWRGKCPVCGRGFPSLHEVNSFTHQEMNPEFQDIEWQRVKEELEK